MKESKSHLEIIRLRVQPEVLLNLIAEEAAELGHAALKLRRAMEATNPTPVSLETALDGLHEEVADVVNALEAWGVILIPIDGHIKHIANEKLERWAERLEEAKNGIFE